MGKKKSTSWPSKSGLFSAETLGKSSMVEYFTRLSILNPPATLSEQLAGPHKREGRFVRLAHAREEFEAPVLSKGKSTRL